MADPGKILVGEFDHSYLVKFSGYVRLTLCASFARYMDRIFHGDCPAQVLIDLHDATGLDSTTLGLIGRLALHCRDQFHIKPLVFCENPDVLRDLTTMALDEFLDIVATPPPEAPLRELCSGETPVSEVRQQVIDAHKLLAKINPEREAEFLDLVRAIEKDTGI